MRVDFFLLNFLSGTSQIKGIIFQSEREARVILCPYGEPDPRNMSKPQGYLKAVRGNSRNQSDSSVVDEAEQKSCSLLLVFVFDFLTSSCSSELMGSLAGIGEMSCCFSGRRTQQMVPVGAGVCVPGWRSLGWLLTSAWHGVSGGSHPV